VARVFGGNSVSCCGFPVDVKREAVMGFCNSDVKEELLTNRVVVEGVTVPFVNTDNTMVCKTSNTTSVFLYLFIHRQHTSRKNYITETTVVVVVVK
jgi:hypothetical protein